MNSYENQGNYLAVGSGLSGSIGTASQQNPRSAPAVLGELALMDKEICFQHELLAQLRERLGGVLSTEPPSEPSKGDASGAACSLALSVKNARLSITGANTVIAEFLRRLEV